MQQDGLDQTLLSREALPSRETNKGKSQRNRSIFTIRKVTKRKTYIRKKILKKSKKVKKASINEKQLRFRVTWL